MSVLQFLSPPMPHYIISGEDIYAAGRSHDTRSKIGVFDLIAVTRGSLFLMENDRTLEVPSNHFAILRPDLMHGGCAPCTEETHFYWLHFYTLGQWSEVSAQRDSLHPPIEVYAKIDQFTFYLPTLGALQHPDSTFAKLNELNILNKQPLSSAKWRQQVLFHELLLQLQEKKRAFADVPHLLVAEQTAAYLRQHYKRIVTYAELADEIHFHPNYIARCMKQVYGCTPHEYLSRYRVEQAKLLLIHTDHSIGSIAEETGFSTFSLFVRNFAKMTGMRPKEFRKQYR